VLAEREWNPPLRLVFVVSTRMAGTPAEGAGGREMGRKLFVGNLPFETAETDLEQLFARVGNVESVNVVRDQMTGRPRGFAFVEMRTDEEAQRAIAELHESELGGRRLAVNEARPKPSGPGGGGGGFRGGRGGGGSRGREPRW